MIANRSVTHGTFSVERTYPVPPERVFASWASRSEKNTWFGEGDDFLATTDEYTLDFRVGGHERLAGTLPSGRLFTYDGDFQDIVDDRRIVSSYDVCIDSVRISVSLMTIELAPVSDGTRLVLTEQGAFLDGLDTNEQRQEGATDMLDQLGEFLKSHA